MKPTIKYTDETHNWSMLKPSIEAIPPENVELMPGLKWGDYSQLYTPAFWKLQYVIAKPLQTEISHRLAPSLIEEIVMCILGGYGIPSEMGILAFNCLKKQKLIRQGIRFDLIHQVLSQPMENEAGKKVKYRFYNQKAKYIYRFLGRSDLNNISQKSDIELRNWLLSIEGIGLKTASWITRNWLKSDNVAILDVHLIRAGKLTGFFNHDSFNYLHFEKKYLAFCTALGVEASAMDAIIWAYMKKNTKLASSLLNS